VCSCTGLACLRGVVDLVFLTEAIIPEAVSFVSSPFLTIFFCERVVESSKIVPMIVQRSVFLRIGFFVL